MIPVDAPHARNAERRLKKEYARLAEKDLPSALVKEKIPKISPSSENVLVFSIPGGQPGWVPRTREKPGVLAARLRFTQPLPRGACPDTREIFLP